MFIYCYNNPLKYIDSIGYSPVPVTQEDAGRMVEFMQLYSCATGLNYDNNVDAYPNELVVTYRVTVEYDAGYKNTSRFFTKTSDLNTIAGLGVSIGGVVAKGVASTVLGYVGIGLSIAGVLGNTLRDEVPNCNSGLIKYTIEYEQYYLAPSRTFNGPRFMTSRMVKKTYYYDPKDGALYNGNTRKAIGRVAEQSQYYYRQRQMREMTY